MMRKGRLRYQIGFWAGAISFVICTDDDLKNLTAAMSLARSYATDHIYVRMSRWPLAAVSEHIGEKHGIMFINISELVLEGIRGLAGVFRAAEVWDLKRTAPREMPMPQITAGPNRMKPAAVFENTKFSAGSLS